MSHETVVGPEQRISKPRMRIAAPTQPVRAAVIVMHGGRQVSFEPTRALQLSALRMRPFAHRLTHKLGRSGVVVATLRFSVKGWNESGSPIADATWALTEIGNRYGAVPVVLLGHSMGGRTAVHSAGFPTVIGVVGLAAWLPPDGEPVEQLRGRRLALFYPENDRVVPPSQSIEYYARALPVAASVQLTAVERSGHALIPRARHWHTLATDTVADFLPIRPQWSTNERVSDA